MAQIRIDTEQVRETGQRLSAEGDHLAQIGQELERAIGGLDTGAWDGRSRARAAPLLNRVRPENARLADELDRLGRKLVRVAEVFEAEDGAAARNFGVMTWSIFDTKGTSEIQSNDENSIGKSQDIGIFHSISNAAVDAAKFLAPGFAVLATEWLPEKVKINSKTWFIGREHKLWPERRGRPRKNKPTKQLRIAAWEDQVWEDGSTGHTKLGGVRFGGKTEAQALKGEVGLGVDFEGGKSMVGFYGGATLITAGASGVIGDTDFGLGAGLDVTVGEAEAFVGFKDGNVGAKIGGSLVSAEGTVGMNIAGWNIGLSGEIGVKFELGIEAGPNARVHLGPFSFGLNIGEALGS